jgi:HAD superfamily phosphoserine phosphatase-like hydrolase
MAVEVDRCATVIGFFRQCRKALDISYFAAYTMPDLRAGKEEREAEMVSPPIRIAVFDIDGTLLPGASVEGLFFRQLLRAGELRWNNLLRMLRHFLRNFPGGATPSIRLNKWFYAGFRVRDLRIQARRFVDHDLFHRLSGEGLSVLERCRQQGCEIVLLSGAPTIFVERLARRLRVKFFFGAELQRSDDFFTGQLEDPHPFGPGKRDMLLALNAENEIDFSSSLAFANHHSDAHHLELFGKPVAVNPTIRLARIARRKGWEIQFFRNLPSAKLATAEAG